MNMANLINKLLNIFRRTTLDEFYESNNNKSSQNHKTDFEELQINGLVLPKSLVERIKSNNWKVPESKAKLLKLVLDNNPFKEEEESIKEMINDFTLYDLDLMMIEYKNLNKLREQIKKEKNYMIFGRKDDTVNPGNIDIEKTILFADFDIGNDTPFGLDYRNDPKYPTVVLLYWGEDAEKDNRWKKIANSFEEFENLIW